MNKTHQLEMLEGRKLLAVTLDNGLLPTDPGHFSAIVGQGGEVQSMRLAGVESLNEYTSFLDLGPNNETLTGAAQVIELSGFSSDSVLQGTEAVSNMLVRLADADDATDPTFDNNPFVTAEIRVSIPQGENRLVTRYTFTAFRYNLTEGRFFQFWDGREAPMTDDFLVVDGSTTFGNLRLRVHDTSTVNFSQMEDGDDSPDSVLAGFAAGIPADLRTLITDGDYNPPAAGDITVPAGAFAGLGNGFGPIPEIGTALSYSLIGSSESTVTTSLALSPGVQGALMEVFHVVDFGTIIRSDFRIPDDTTVRSATLGTDFGSSFAQPQTHIFAIRNRGLENLFLYGVPKVQIVGDVNDFRVTRQPTPTVEGGAESFFFVQFLPTTPGLRSATVQIFSNDPTTTPFTFVVYGGSGTGIQPDVYEDDGNGSDIRRRFFDAAVTPEIARVVSTDGVWKVHSIHQSNDVDWSVFEIIEETDVLIQTTAPAGDTRMYVYNEKGFQVGYDNDSGAGSAAALYLHLTPGIYYVRVDEFGNNATIPVYGLSVRAKPNVQLSDDPIFLDGDGKLSVFGTSGSDTISVDIFSNSLRVTVNDSQVFFPLSEVRSLFVNGRGGADTIFAGIGSPAADLRGAGGRDSITVDSFNNATIFGGAGDDVVFAGRGNDLINGKAGDDTITAGGGFDFVIGGPGNDVISGGNGGDTLQGSVGNDTILGEGGSDVIIGGPDLVIFPDTDNDQLIGGVGNDTLTGGAGTDVIDSGEGMDLIAAADNQPDTLFGNLLLDVISRDPADLDILNNDVSVLG